MIHPIDRKKIITISSVFVMSILGLVYPLLNKVRLSYFYSNCSFYILCLMAGYWVYLFLVDRLPKLSKMFKDQADLKFGLLICLLFTLMIILSSGWHFRCLADETNFLSISKNMLEHHKVDNIVMGRWYFYDYHPTSTQIDWRPLFYSYLVFIFHTFLGYRTVNAFLVNAVVCFLSTFILYTRLSRYKGRLWALSAIFLIFSNPSITQIVTSAGFDFISCSLTLYCFVIFADYLKDPNEKDFKWLWINLVVLSNTRYESILVFLITAFFILIWRMVDFKWLFSRFVFGITPLLLAPRIWLFFLFYNEIFQSSEGAYEVPTGEKTWQWRYFWEHTKLFFSKIFDFNYDALRFANVVILLGVVGCFYGILFILPKKEFWKTEKKKTAIYLASVFASLWVITTSYYAAAVDGVTTGRYYAIFFAVLTLLGLWFLSRFLWIDNRRHFLVVFSILMFIIYHPLTVTSRSSYSVYLTREFRFSLDYFLQKRKLDTSWNPIIISPRANLYVPFNLGAATPAVAIREKWDIKRYLDQSLATDAYVVQEIEFKTMKPTAESMLDSDYHLAPVREVYVSPEFFMRISHVEKIDLPVTS